MREILFKAKRIDTGEWAEGWLVPTMQNTYHDRYIIIDLRGINYDELDYFEPTFISWEVDPSTICQFTGLFDKNRNRIWENDILCNCGTKYNPLCVVKFGEHSTNIGFYCDWKYEGIPLRNDVLFWTENRVIEVIGNVFDNAELLKE